MGPEVSQLVAIIDQAYNRTSWHGTNLRGSLRRVTPAQAAWRPAPGRHNIWEIAVHAAYWKYAAARRLTGGLRGSFPLKGSNWFQRPSVSPASMDKAWKADLALLDDMHDALRAAVVRLSAKDLSRTPPGKKVSNFALLSGVAAHDLYHAGQIQVLKRLLPFVLLFVLTALAHAQRNDEVRVPGGTFTMGTNASGVDALMARFSSKRRELFASELPAHPVTVRPFFIDRAEVTNAAFKIFVDAHPGWSRERLAADRHNGEYLKTWTGGSYPAGEADLPVTFITWHAASAFCESAGKRLPTEAEWEFAAGGGRAAEFPWGDDAPDAAKANWSGAKLGKPSPAGRFPAAHGLHDMAGNVWEYVADPWKDSYLDGAKTSPGRRVIRGGSFGGSPVNLRVRYRDSHPELGAGLHVGFRCARTME